MEPSGRSIFFSRTHNQTFASWKKEVGERKKREKNLDSFIDVFIWNDNHLIILCYIELRQLYTWESPAKRLKHFLSGKLFSWIRHLISADKPCLRLSARQFPTKVITWNWNKWSLFIQYCLPFFGWKTVKRRAMLKCLLLKLIWKFWDA